MDLSNLRFQCRTWLSIASCIHFSKLHHHLIIESVIDCKVHFFTKTCPQEENSRKQNKMNRKIASLSRNLMHEVNFTTITMERCCLVTKRLCCGMLSYNSAIKKIYHFLAVLLKIYVTRKNCLYPMINLFIWLFCDINGLFL